MQTDLLTCTFVVQSAVRFWIRLPDTPGGFNDSMACKPASSSATAEDMVTGPRLSQFSQYRSAMLLNKQVKDRRLLSMPFLPLDPPIQATMENDEDGDGSIAYELRSTLVAKGGNPATRGRTRRR